MTNSDRQGRYRLVKHALADLHCSPVFSRRSVGYVDASDGWQDLMGNFKIDWEFHKAEGGNIMSRTTVLFGSAA